MTKLNLLTTVILTLALFVTVSWWALHFHTSNGTATTGASASIGSVISAHEHEKIKNEVESAVREAKVILANLRAKNVPPGDVSTRARSEIDSQQPATTAPLINPASMHAQDSSIVANRAPERVTVPMPATLPKLHAVTYASHHGRDDRFCRYNYELVVLGWQVKWEGLSQKLEAAHAYAASIPDNDLMLFTDAFDVLYTAEARQIVETFVSRNYTILFAAECGCWPHIMEDKKICTDIYPKSPTPYRYLNSGTWIGYAKNARIMLAEVIKLAGNDFKNANDQKLVADMFLAGKHGIQLDYFSEIFQSMHRTDPPGLAYCDPHPDMQLTPQRTWQNKRTSSHPAVFHFNGGGKAYHLSMERQVWYKSQSYYRGSTGKKLSEQLVIVPSQQSGKLAFDEICPDYVQIMLSSMKK